MSRVVTMMALLTDLKKAKEAGHPHVTVPTDKLEWLMGVIIAANGYVAAQERGALVQEMAKAEVIDAVEREKQ